MDPTTETPGVDPAKMSAPGGRPESDPLVRTWTDRIKRAEKHWSKLHQRMRHNRKLVRGINDDAEPNKPEYNRDRANLIQSTIQVVLSKVYAKNPEMSAKPKNKAVDLRLFADTLSTVTQTMLEDAALKKKAKASVRAAMTCSYGVVKVQYQRVTKGESDPIIRARIQDTQDNIERLQGLAAEMEDEKDRCDADTKKRELEEVLAGLRAQSEVVAAEGLVIDRVRSDRLLVDPAVEDIWEYESADWMVEKIPMRKGEAKGRFPGLDLSTATTYKLKDEGEDSAGGRMYSPAPVDSSDDATIMVYEVWSKMDNRIFTLVDGCTKNFAREPYTPKVCGERWWAYFILPFQSVDGEFAAQSLVDVLEKLQVEHNETRDKFAQLRRTIRPHFHASGDLKDKDIRIMTHPELGEIVVVNTNGAPLAQMLQQAPQLKIDPSVFDTSPIRNDWEMVSGLQDAARSTVIQPKTATEAAISNQSLSARVEEFRDQIEDWLTEIAQYSSELCLLAMTPAQVETIMGKNPEPKMPAMPMMTGPMLPGMPMPEGQMPQMPGMLPGMPMDEPEEQAAPVYYWPDQRTPDTVFNLVQMEIRAGSTAAPNKLEMQENWGKALAILGPMIDKIRMVEASGGDATPERELVKETAARFDETIDIERFLPQKPQPPAMPPMGAPAPGMGAPGMAAPLPPIPMPAPPMAGGMPDPGAMPMQ